MGSEKVLKVVEALTDLPDADADAEFLGQLESGLD
jgi:hypothetical protein